MAHLDSEIDSRRNEGAVFSVCSKRPKRWQGPAATSVLWNDVLSCLPDTRTYEQMPSISIQANAAAVSFRRTLPSYSKQHGKIRVARRGGGWRSSGRRNSDTSCLMFFGPFVFGLSWLLMKATGVLSSNHSGGNYLYAGLDPKEAYPVTELLHPDHLDNISSGILAEGEHLRPAFLYPQLLEGDDEHANATITSSVVTGTKSATGTGDRHRIVEFYAPWCGHCQNFKKDYIKLAKTLKELNADIDIYAVSCVAHHSLCSRQSIHSYPKVLLFKANEYNGTTIRTKNLDPLYLFKRFGITDTDNQGKGENKSLWSPHLRVYAPPNNRKRNEIEKVTTREQIYTDAVLSFDFSMKNSIFTSDQPLDDKQKEALEQWLALLRSALPPSWDIHDTIDAIQAEQEQVFQNEATLLDILEKHPAVPATTTEWTDACSRGKRGEGYTCGLWELLHTATIGIVEFNMLDKSSDEALVIPTSQVAHIIRAFIEHFFGCEECRTNFIKDYDDGLYGRRERLSTKNSKNRDSLMQLPLWLWETHNAVNVRLMEENAKREGNRSWSWSPQDVVNAHWPSRSECPPCRNRDETWNETIVYKFLRNHYWLDDATSEEYRKVLKELSVSKGKLSNFGEVFSLSSYAYMLPYGGLAVLIFWLCAKERSKKKSGKLCRSYTLL